MLEISALGFPLTIKNNGHRIKASKKACALLVYMACANGQPVSRGRMKDLLWPYQGHEQSCHSLRNCLTELRKVIGDADSMRGWRDLRLDALEFGAVAFDVWRLEAAAHANDAQAIATLYRGPFLDDFVIVSEPWHEWLTVTQERLQMMAVHVLERAAAQALANNKPDDAITLASRLLEIDRLHEPAHQHIIAAHRACGRDVAAVRQYHDCARSLKLGLDVAPSEATMAAARGLPITALTTWHANTGPVLIVKPATSLRAECRRVGLEAKKALDGAAGQKPTRRGFEAMADLLLRVANTPAIDTPHQNRNAA